MSLSIVTIDIKQRYDMLLERENDNLMNKSCSIGINSRLQDYMENNIVKQYKLLDSGHNEKHIFYVIERSLKMAKLYNANINMSYTVAAYHDLGMIEDRAIHEVISGNLLMNDKNLRNWFDLDQILVMKQAVEQHRASYVYEPTTIYGKIISQADRNFDIKVIVCRAIEYGKKFYPEYSFSQHFDRVYSYIEKKYGYNGYINIWLNFDDDNKKLDEVRSIIYFKKNQFKAMCKAYYDNDIFDCYSLLY